MTAGLTGNQLTLTTSNFGSSAQIAIGAGDALTALGFSGTETGTGTDVAGYFEVNGIQESATGAGQLLTGNTGNANTSGLAADVDLTPGAGRHGNPGQRHGHTGGFASALSGVLNNILDPSTGQADSSINNNFTN